MLLNYHFNPIKFKFNQQKIRTQKPKICSYKDRIQLDNHDMMFYIYYIGRYKNKPIYNYGQTIDIDIVELHLRQNVPIYKKKLHIPVEHHVYGKQMFDDYVKMNEIDTQIPIHGMEHVDAFTTNEKFNYKHVLNEIYNIFQIIEV